MVILNTVVIQYCRERNVSTFSRFLLLLYWAVHINLFTFSLLLGSKVVVLCLPLHNKNNFSAIAHPTLFHFPHSFTQSLSECTVQRTPKQSVFLARTPIFTTLAWTPPWSRTQSRTTWSGKSQFHQPLWFGRQIWRWHRRLWIWVLCIFFHFLLCFLFFRLSISSEIPLFSDEFLFGIGLWWCRFDAFRRIIIPSNCFSLTGSSVDASCGIWCCSFGYFRE